MEIKSEHCQTCFKPISSINDQLSGPITNIIQCRLCKKKAHQYCYSPDHCDPLNFVCDPCKRNKSRSKTSKCIICGQCGLLKAVDSCYGHVLCLAYNALYFVKSYHRLEFISLKITKNKALRSKKKCEICKLQSQVHTLIKCQNNCRNYAHIYCIKKNQYLQDSLNTTNCTKWRHYLGQLNLNINQNFMERNIDAYKLMIKNNFPKVYHYIWGSSSIPNQTQITKPCQSEFYCRNHSTMMPVECFCKLNSDPEFIQCDRCLIWTHISCQGLKLSELTNDFFQCKHCLQWKVIINLKKRPILENYPQLHFCELVYIHRYYEERNYNISQKDEQLLSKIELKPSLKFYHYFSKNCIYDKVRHRIDIQIVGNVVVKQEIYDEKEKKKTKQKSLRNSRECTLNLIAILLSHDFQLQAINHQLQEKQPYSEQKAADLINAYENINISHLQSKDFSIMVSTGETYIDREIKDEEIVQIATNQASINQKSNTKSQKKVSQNSTVIRETLANQKKFEEQGASRIGRMMILNEQIKKKQLLSLRKFRITEFFILFKQCSDSEKQKTIHLLQEIQSQFYFTNQWARYASNYKHSEEFLAIKITLKFMDDSLKLKGFQTTSEYELKIKEKINKEIRYFVPFITCENKKTIQLFNNLCFFKHQVINMTEKTEKTNKPISFLSFLEAFKVTQNNQKFLLQFLSSIQTLDGFNEIRYYVEPIAYRLLMMNTNKVIRSQTEFMAYQFICRQFNIECKWAKDELRKREHINEIIKNVDMNKIKSLQQCKFEERKFKDLLINMKREKDKQYVELQNTIMHILDQLSCLSLVFNNIPQWALFPQLNHDDKITDYSQKVNATKVREIMSEFEKYNFPKNTIKRRIEDLITTIQQQTAIIEQFLERLNINICNQQSLLSLKEEDDRFCIIQLNQALGKMKESYIDYSELISEIQEIMRAFYEYEHRLMYANKQESHQNLQQLIKQFKLVPLKCSEIIQAFKSEDSKVNVSESCETKSNMFEHEVVEGCGQSYQFRFNSIEFRYDSQKITNANYGLKNKIRSYQ